MVQRIRFSLGTSLVSLAAFGGAMAVLACSSGSSSTTSGGPGDAAVQPAEETGTPTLDSGAPAPTFDPASPTDPIGSADQFTLALALAGFPAGGGKLTAAILTEKGSIKCELAEAAAPISVANFVGLARGTRPYKAAGKWKAGHFYDGLIWHRVIPNFVIQGGDPLGTGTGGPGYDLVKENQIEEPLGTLAMAASAKVSGSQFYVVVGKGPAADYNVFGTCATENAVTIAKVPRDADDLPTVPVHLLKVEIARCP